MAWVGHQQHILIVNDITATIVSFAKESQIEFTSDPTADVPSMLTKIYKKKKNKVFDVEDGNVAKRIKTEH